jgi:hypothetical protein
MQYAAAPLTRGRRNAQDREDRRSQVGKRRGLIETAGTVEVHAPSQQRIADDPRTETAVPARRSSEAACRRRVNRVGAGHAEPVAI